MTGSTLTHTESRTEKGKRIGLSGRLDTVTAPGLEDYLVEASEGETEIELDIKDLEYISSAGLRVLLVLHKAMAKNDGRACIINCSPQLKEIFEVTGFDDILDIAEA